MSKGITVRMSGIGVPMGAPSERSRSPHARRGHEDAAVCFDAAADNDATTARRCCCRGCFCPPHAAAANIGAATANAAGCAAANSHSGIACNTGEAAVSPIVVFSEVL